MGVSVITDENDLENDVKASNCHNAQFIHQRNNTLVTRPVPCPEPLRFALLFGIAQVPILSIDFTENFSCTNIKRGTSCKLH